jgi:hypothetical protein
MGGDLSGRIRAVVAMTRREENTRRRIKRNERSIIPREENAIDGAIIQMMMMIRALYQVQTTAAVGERRRRRVARSINEGNEAIRLTVTTSPQRNNDDVASQNMSVAVHLDS